MVHIIGVWELGWNTPIKEVELWEYPLRDFGVEKFYMTPVSGIQSSSVTEVASMEQLLEEYRKLNIPIVFVDEHGTTELKEFTHPETALYVFGKASFSPFKAYAKDKDMSVVIRTEINSGLLWPHQAAAILLYDRENKWQS